jgi:hypothetical protein
LWGTRDVYERNSALSNRLVAAVLAALAVNVIVTGYGALAAGEEARAHCAAEHGVVQGHECVKGGQELFRVPL